MRTFSFILTLLLTLAWGYTSWYWYTCNIKGFCNGQTSLPMEESVETDFTYTGGNSDAQRLSVEDVLVASQKVQTQTGSEQREDTQSGTTQTVTATGELSAPADENLIKVTQDTAAENLNICTGNFVGPVAQVGKNDSEQVKLLENFLLSQGNTVSVDGVYSTSEVEAVKAFQLEHKQEILDPWGIAAPTGYVFTTTIKKMKEIACE